VAPCIHTRNDILSSQNTIHPKDDRVFSIRELMRMMSIPEDFKWTPHSLAELNKLPLLEKKKYLQNNQMNIRQCLGEAVPTRVIYNIATKIRKCIQKSKATNMQGKTAVRNIGNVISATTDLVGLESLMCEIEIYNKSRSERAAFYTPPVSAFKLLQMIPNLRDKKSIRVLEPSVGIGRILHFLPQLLVSFDEVVIDAIDIDSKMLSIAEKISTQLPQQKNLEINFLAGDFLDLEIQEPYDLIIGNPPFGKIPEAKTLDYADLMQLSGSRNMFALFMYKSLKTAKNVVLVAPKSILNAPDMNKLRSDINAKHSVIGICDFGEKGFEGVKIETIALAIKTNRRQKAHDLIRVESIPQNLDIFQKASSIFESNLPYWLLYRNKNFDDMLDRMKFGIFNVFRDRQISKRHFAKNGETRVIKGKNIMPVEVQFYDKDYFINDASSFAASRFLDRDDIALVPNLTMKPRVSRMPKGCVADGSVAILYPKNENSILSDKDMRFLSSPEFCDFYRIARNYGTRSLNIDANSVFFFGIRQDYA
ncbi:MAG: Eco57I restriction-modification methylase domain-containing protein, partial [Alphaproteobacteria bacterium]|nr:Eco57I restriction-modification methylase domain-containing protein [Alphaproteobacteria bacterium]